MVLTATISHGQLPPELAISRFEVREGLSQLFTVEVVCISGDPDWDLASLPGTEACVALLEDGEPSRRFHGMVEEAELVGRRGDLFAYRLKLMPRLQALAHRVRSRIFQDRSVVAIVREVLSGAGIPDDAVSWRVTEGPPREYCTQWRESELSFLLRLLEEDGIFFWFEHSDSGHVLHFGEGPAAHAPIDGAPGLSFRSWENPDEPLREIVTAVTYTARHVPDAVMLRDWDWRSPQGPSEARHAAGTGAFEHYEFPVPFSSAQDGKLRAQDRLAAARVVQRTLRGETPSPRLAPGRLFQLFDAEPAAINGEYLLREVRHTFENPGAGITGALESSYRAALTAMPAELEFRPPHVTPRPRVAGKELAVVTGPPGEEIHVDRFGRVKVHFYWDREGKVDDTSSCWIRVQQQNTSGSQVLPRVGWEVEVGFLYGDPDRPLVLQKLYNAETLPPYALPDNLMQSSLQSSSSPGGGGTNEIRMNDGGGAMEFFVHAQKDLSVEAGNNLTEQIAVDETVQVKSDCTSTVAGTEDVCVGGNQSASITGAAVQTTTGARSVEVGAMDQWGVGGMHAVNVKGARTEDIGGLMNVLAQKVTETFNADLSTGVGGVLSINSVGPIVESVKGNKTETVAGAKLEIIGKAKAENVGLAKALTAGLVKVKTGKDLSMEAGAAMAITTGGPMAIKCGGDFNISGRSVTINVGKATVEAGSKLSATPASLKVEGSTVGGDGAQVKLKGTVHYK